MYTNMRCEKNVEKMWKMYRNISKKCGINVEKVPKIYGNGAKEVQKSCENDEKRYRKMQKKCKINGWGEMWERCGKSVKEVKVQKRCRTNEEKVSIPNNS